MCAGFGREDRGDGVVRFDGGVVFVVDGDAVEQGTVEHAAFDGFGFRVDLMEIGQQPEDAVEPDFRVLVGRGVEGTAAPRLTLASLTARSATTTPTTERGLTRRTGLASILRERATSTGRVRLSRVGAFLTSLRLPGPNHTGLLTTHGLTIAEQGNAVS